MKDTRKLSLVYFGISVILLLIFLCGCAKPYMEVDYIHTVNGYDVYYAEAEEPEYIEMYAEHLKESIDNFVIQSDFGIIEVQDGEIIYNNIK